MAILKCKMCGGDLNIQDGITVAECEYCGIRQTVPNADNEKKLALFTRANRLRANCEFDKAAGVYETIVAEFPEEAEAYWGLVLCSYGIEYVDDPATGKKTPTCHRSSFESVLDDSNFELVMEYADPVACSVYREEAKQIEELRKGIIAVSSKEEPYDIFICFKDKDESGERTIDSVLAQDVYQALVEKGYRVFFSRITLEDRLGSEYEPYIFAALNSAKIMLAFGTKYEYYNAVWVKNEWSRFLQLIERGEKKTLIPCYKNIDAYDMPKEFARLQAQDLGKVGALQDLLRGIEKILPRQTAPQAAAMPMGGVAQSATTETLLRRARMYIEDTDWDNAIAYSEKVLDIHPENAEAYLCKLLAELRVKNRSALGELREPFEHRASYQRLLQFAEPALVEEMKGYNRGIVVRNTFNQAKSAYQRGLTLQQDTFRAIDRARQDTAFNSAGTMNRTAEKFLTAMREAEEHLAKLEPSYRQQLDVQGQIKLVRDKLNACNYALAKIWMQKGAEGSVDAAKNAAQTLEALGDYQDSPALLQQARELELSAIYRYAVELSRRDPNGAAAMFDRMGDYKNARQNAQLCRNVYEMQGKIYSNEQIIQGKQSVIGSAQNQLGNSPAYAGKAMKAFIIYIILIGIGIMLIAVGAIMKENRDAASFGGLFLFAALIFAFVKRTSIKDRTIINSILFTFLCYSILIIFPIEMLHEYFFWNHGTGKHKDAISQSEAIIAQLNAQNMQINQEIENVFAQII